MTQNVSTTITDKVMEVLVNRIVSGAIRPGAKLSEQELADTLKVSRAPLREAIRRLEGLNLVRHVPHVGARVVDLSRAELVEVYAVREALEGMAAGLAASRMEQAEVDGLRRLLDLHEETIDRSAGSEYLQQQGDFDFHYRIIHGSGNRRLIDFLCRELYHLIRMYRFRSGTVAQRPRAALAEHRQILEAIADHDAQFAEMLMRRHIQKARICIEQQFTELGEAAHAGQRG